MKTAQFLKTLVLVFVMLVLMPSVALAVGQLKSAKLKLSDPRVGQSSSHTFTFTVSTGSGTMEEMQFQYCKTPSGTCITPGMDTATADLDEQTSSGITDWGWTLTTASLGNNTLIIQESNLGEEVLADDVVIIEFDTITNSAITACDVATDTDTCYVRVTTCNDLGCDTNEPLDYATVSYTAVAPVVVSARVDPLFTFVVTGVNAGTGTSGATTTVTSDYNTLPFSNLTPGTPRYAAHKLTVTTNTDTGYVVYIQMQQQMTGVYGGNIDPYAATTVTWANPIAWTEPTGNVPNIETGWIGANTNDNDVDNWTGDNTGQFGPVNSSENLVMKSTTSDNGAVSIYVTYAIEANIYQPADTYTGRLVYNALPTY